MCVILRRGFIAGHGRPMLCFWFNRPHPLEEFTPAFAFPIFPLLSRVKTDADFGAPRGKFWRSCTPSPSWSSSHSMSSTDLSWSRRVPRDCLRPTGSVPRSWRKKKETVLENALWKRSEKACGWEKGGYSDFALDGIRALREVFGINMEDSAAKLIQGRLPAFPVE